MADILEAARTIAAALKLRPSGGGKNWRGTCPACNDANPSLSLTADPDTLLVHCFAGCTQAAVLGAIREIDPALWPSDLPVREVRQGDPSAITIYGVGDMLRRPPVKWLIKNVLPERGIIALIGEPGGGKSFLALDMAGALLGRKEWLGQRVKQTCGVLYIAAEGGRGFGARVGAYQRTYPGAEWAMFGMIDAPLNFLDPVAVDNLIISMEVRERAGNGFGLIVIDTVNQTMRGADENSVEGMSAYLYGVGRVVSHFDMCALLIHHTGKDASRGARGSTALLGAVDGELMLTVERSGADPRAGERGTPTGLKHIRGSKMRDGALMDTRAFQLQQVVLDRDADGDPVTSCIVKPAGWDGGE